MVVTMKTRRMTFVNDDGHRLSGILNEPESDEPAALALVAHCFTCSKDSKGVAFISRALAKEGIAAFRFDFTGLGDSEGDFVDTGFSTNVADLVAAARFLEQQAKAPRLLVGHSLGGAAVLKAAGRVASAKAVATIAAPSSPQHLLRHIAPARNELERRGEAEINIAGRSFRVRKQFLDEISGSDLRDAIGGLGRALLVLHSPADLIVGIDNAEAIFRAAKHPKSFVSLNTADHLLSNRDDANFAASLIATWARWHLRGT